MFLELTRKYHAWTDAHATSFFVAGLTLGGKVMRAYVTEFLKRPAVVQSRLALAIRRKLERYAGYKNSFSEWLGPNMCRLSPASLDYWESMGRDGELLVRLSTATVLASD